MGAGRGRGGTMGGVGFAVAGAIFGRGVGVATGRDHGQRMGLGVGFVFGAAAAVEASKASNDNVAKNFMNGSNRRERREAQRGHRVFLVQREERE